MEPCHKKTCLIPYANNKGVNQPAHLHSLISTFVCSLDSVIIPVLSRSKISKFCLFSVGDQASFSLIWSQTPREKFSREVADCKETVTQVFYSTFLAISLLSREFY